MDAIKKTASKDPKQAPPKKYSLRRIGGAFVCIVAIATGIAWYSGAFVSPHASASTQQSTIKTAVLPAPAPIPALDKAAYDAKLAEISHSGSSTAPAAASVSSTETSSVNSSSTATLSATPILAPLWPAKAVYPNAGALLPFNRIVAFYGNFYSKGMGVLGQYPAPVMLAKLATVVQEWQAADPTTPVIPAIHYIAVTAQGSPGADGKYRLRMPDSQIDYAISLARQIHGITFLDVQVGDSTVQEEIPLLAKYLAMPDVDLGLDPEFSMKNGQKPGTVIGSMDASDINFVLKYLSNIVKENNLSPKILIVHRFTQDMVTNTQDITPLPEVQVVMNMDGWGSPSKKIAAYNEVIYPYPVQFTGFKLFFKNDIVPPDNRMLTPTEILKLTPSPMYIQYQ